MQQFPQQGGSTGRRSRLERGFQQASLDERPQSHQQHSLPDSRLERNGHTSPRYEDRHDPPIGERSRAYTTGQPPEPQYRQPAMPGYHASAPPPLSQAPSRAIPTSQRSRDDYGNPQAGAAPSYHLQQAQQSQQQYKCVPLVPGLLAVLQLEVVNSNIKTGDRSRELVIFHVRMHLRTSLLSSDDQRRHLIPSNAPKSWIIEKSWVDVQNVDSQIRSKNPKSNLRKLPSLPDKHLFKDHAPSKVDQRKKDLQKYLQAVCEAVILQERGDVCAFLTSNIVSDRSAPVSNPGYKAGYLTKKGRNFGGWTTRYYVLQGRMLEYYDAVSGRHLKEALELMFRIRSLVVNILVLSISKMPISEGRTPSQHLTAMTQFVMLSLSVRRTRQVKRRIISSAPKVMRSGITGSTC